MKKLTPLFEFSFFLCLLIGMLSSCTTNQADSVCGEYVIASLQEKSESCRVIDLPTSLKNIEQILTTLDTEKASDTTITSMQTVLLDAKEEVESLEESKYYLFVANYLKYLSEIYYAKREISKVLPTLHEAEKLLDKHVKNRCDSIIKASVYSYLGVNYRLIDKYDKAVFYSKKVLEHNKNFGQHKQVAVEYSNLALAYLGKKELQKATESNEKALCIWDNIGRNSKDIDLYLQAAHNKAVIKSAIAIKYYNDRENELARTTFDETIIDFYEVLKLLEKDTLMAKEEKINREIYVLVNIARNYILSNRIFNIGDKLENLEDIVAYVEKMEQEPIKKYYKLLLYPLLGIFDAERGLCEKADQKSMEGIKGGLVSLADTVALADAAVLNNQKTEYLKALHIRGAILEICYQNSNDLSILKKALDAHLETVKYLENRRKDRDETMETKEDLIQLFHFYYFTASATAAKLYELTGETIYFDTAFDLADRKKGIALKEALRKKQTNLTDYRKPKSTFETLNLENIQKQWLDKETAIIAYALGYHQSFVFLLTAQKKVIVPIKADSILIQTIDDYAKTLEEKLGYFSEESTLLYKRLVAPLEKYLTGIQIKKIVFVPDGKINKVSFAALLTKPITGSESNSAIPYLIKDYTISYLPSLSIGNILLKEERASRTNKLLNFKAFVANPAKLSLENRKDENVALTTLPKAYQTFKENDAIDAIDQATQQIVAANFSRKDLQTNATKKDFLSSSAESGVLHLVAHGYRDEESPMKSTLAFVPTALEDGKLEMGEVYNLSFNADLLYLASCHANAGILDDVEGVISPSRAFLHAGCKGVISNMRKVEDEEIALMTTLFYRAFLEDKLSVQEALRKAQLDYIETKIQAEEDTKPANWATYHYTGIDAFSPLIFSNLQVSQ